MDIEKIEIPKKEESSKVRVHFWMSKKLYDYLEYVASRDEQTMSDVVRKAIREMMIKDKSLKEANNASTD